ncbi:YycH family regulatory protein [Fictibacillus barbaricus]|uniref:Regulatory protein YycH domain-containing protein n=1 Tax=Fictibacillus barbaricus TaxID=182136 RepID=A0ABS2ZDB6_9BACL|nr:two-component system activity regulator YycH [Fictibacillus barbaricus]MBN3546190.1 hypothetical protein [Fictibacillus barbaricus]GGB39201.1 hypothetical protein GCM10007199_00380 [Fictibacillus barbaricus]
MNWLKWITHTRKVITYVRENRELIKSVVLTSLIALSLVLTWSLWTFKPSYPALEDPRTVKKEMVEDQLSLSEAVYPTQVIYHKDNELYGAEANNQINLFHKVLSETRFTFDTGPKNDQTFDPADESFIKKTNYVEVIYPVGMSQEIYKDVFSFEAAQITASKPQNVDRLYLYQSNTGGVEGYLISYQPQKKQKIKAINNDALLPLLKQMNQLVAKEDFKPYVSHDIKEETSEGENEIKDRFYFPMNSIIVNSNAYISKAINEETKEKYKKALFKDPLAVKSASTAVNEETFTDGTAAMVINETENRFTYTNFAGLTNGSQSTINSPLFLSIDYVNTHAGWGGNPYIVSSLDNETAGFWLYVDELPVLDDDMQMSLSWSEGELYQYKRSMVELDTQSKYYPEDLSETIKLESGNEVIQELKAADYNENYIKDVRIGYSIRRQSKPHIYILEPKWFINYENQGWSPLFKADREEGF